MGLKEDLHSGGYFHPTWGAVSNLPHTSLERNCSNYHLHNAEYHLRLYLLGEEDPLHAEECFNFIEACEIPGYPGLFARYPGNPEGDISQDDLYGLCFLSYLYGWPFADQIVKWGFEHYWCYNTRSPEVWDKTYWFMRHPAFKPFVLECSQDKTLPLWERLRRSVSLHHQFQWAGALADSSRSPYGNTYGKMFMHLQAALFYKKHWFTDLEIKRWQKEMSALYPGGLRELDGIYFPNHPFGSHSPRNFQFKEILPNKPLPTA